MVQRSPHPRSRNGVFRLLPLFLALVGMGVVALSVLVLLLWGGWTVACLGLVGIVLSHLGLPGS